MQHRQTEALYFIIAPLIKFSFVVCVFWCLMKTTKILFCIFSENLTVLPLTFGSTVHLELSSVY